MTRPAETKFNIGDIIKVRREAYTPGQWSAHKESLKVITEVYFTEGEYALRLKNTPGVFYAEKSYSMIRGITAYSHLELRRITPTPLRYVILERPTQ